MLKSSPGPWRWFNASTLVSDIGNRPVVLTANSFDKYPILSQRDADGILVEFDVKSPDAIVNRCCARLTSCLRIDDGGCIRKPYPR